MTWRLVRSLDVLRAQVRAAAPRAVPPATPAAAWGTVGDLAHQSGTSDHNPATYTALGTTPVVCAADFPHAPALGLDGGAFTEALRLSRDPRVGYVIFNGRIFSSVNTPWTWRTYTGSDQHRDHWHVSTVHTALADSTAPWRMPATTDGDDMSADTEAIIKAWSVGLTKTPAGSTVEPVKWRISDEAWQRRVDASLAALTSVLNSLVEIIQRGGGDVDMAAILEAMDAKLADLAAEQRDAVADLGEGGAAQVRADA